MTERIDPALTKGNRQQLAGYRATHFREAARAMASDLRKPRFEGN